jgi:sugar lactone lactonase YvrE
MNTGMPDGMAIDQQGMLWIALWGGFAVQRWDPTTGNQLETIQLPAPNITSCAFGGPNLDYLFITSAKAGLSSDELEKYPEAGNLFIRKMKVKGLNSFKFGEEN